MDRQEIAARLVRELSPDQFDAVRQLAGLEAEHARDEADARLERVIRETAEHFPATAPAIIAVSRHVILNVDGIDYDACQCLE